MKNIQTVNKIISRDKGIDEAEVTRINSFFWKKINKKLSNLESTSVSIKHLGTITVSKRAIDKFIRDTIGKIRNTSKSPRFKETTKVILIDKHYSNLRKALVKRNELAKQYYENWLKRRKRISPTDPINSEELGQDLGRDSEPSETGVQHIA